MIRAAYLGADGFEAPLQQELGRRGVTVGRSFGRLLLSPDPPVTAAWALDTWTDPHETGARSVRAAADALRAVQRNWAAYGVEHHRRMALIADRLPPVKAAPLAFPASAPSAHLGGWTLLAPDRLLFSPANASPFVNGECHFIEDHSGPPSRAYLKLWEALTRLRRWPAPGERCLDLGAAPGGWTWVLARLGADVTAVEGAFGPGRGSDAGRGSMPGKRFRSNPRAGGLAVQRRSRLPGPAPRADAPLDRCRGGTEYYLHDQVPGTDGP